MLPNRQEGPATKFPYECPKQLREHFNTGLAIRASLRWKPSVFGGAGKPLDVDAIPRRRPKPAHTIPTEL